MTSLAKGKALVTEFFLDFVQEERDFLNAGAK
jgi:hypothetical protein